jgi:steroid 5-alpha reductase family enzyme
MEKLQSLAPLFAANLGALLAFMVLGWLLSLARKRADLADRLWGLGFVLVAWLTFFQAEGFVGRKALIVGLTTLWGLRLFIHISWRSRGRGEDPRYGAMRAKHGERFWIVSLFKVFLIQSLFLWVISLGLQYGQTSALPAAITLLDLAGMVIWTTGFLCESVADYQLGRFIADPANRGRVMTRGLWRYSRHPNYFGESLIWWGMFVIVTATPGGYWTIISPVVITWTLLRVSGVTLMEKTIFGDNREYQDYIRRTSSFIPWFPRK